MPPGRLLQRTKEWNASRWRGRHRRGGNTMVVRLADVLLVRTRCNIFSNRKWVKVAMAYSVKNFKRENGTLPNPSNYKSLRTLKILDANKPVTARESTTHRNEMDKTGNNLGEKNSSMVFLKEFLMRPNLGITLFECCGPMRNRTL